MNRRYSVSLLPARKRLMLRHNHQVLIVCVMWRMLILDKVKNIRNCKNYRNKLFGKSSNYK